jgi:hypothetical protein
LPACGSEYLTPLLKLAKLYQWEGNSVANKPEDLPVATYSINELSGEKPG